jgi:hypothetical protein
MKNLVWWKRPWPIKSHSHSIMATTKSMHIHRYRGVPFFI